MRKYSNKFNKIIISDTEEENPISSSNYPPYQIVHQRNFTNMSSYQDQGDYYSKKMQFSSPYNNILTEPSQQKVDFTSKNTAKSYMEKRAYTPSHITRNNYNFQESKNKNGYFSGANNKDIVNIKRMYYKGSQTPEQNRGFISGDDYDFEFKKDENFLENYGYHESKNIKNKDDKKYEFVTYVNGYSNLVPINNSSSNTRIETYNNYNYRREQEFQPKLVNTVERVRELQRGKKEYDEFMRKLGAQDPEEERIEKFEKYKKEQIRQQEIREEKIRMERLEKDRLREQQIKNEKLRQEKMRQEQIRMERMRHEEELRKEKMRNELSRKEELKLIKIREEKIRQEKIRQEKIREERIRQEKIKQEKIRQEKIKQDKITQEKLSQERLKQQQKPKKSVQKKVETYKKITVNTEVNNPRSDSVKKQFKAHSGKYTYKDNIMEEINHYRSNSNYNKEFNNISKKETVYKNKKNKESSKSSSKLPIKIDIKANTNKSTSYSRNYSSQNFKSISKQESNKNMNISYQIKTTKTQTNINIKNYRIAPKKITTNTSNYSKKSYPSNTSYTNKSKTKSIPV